MLLKIMNKIVGLFGYEWVIDSSIIKPERHIGVEDEGWDDIYDNNPKYKLKKQTKPGKFK
ncbi:hypothetical protein JCM30760_01590 [Thiomicrorhabdus hydrogeniphila]